jgi:Protein of unknown function (DUF5818)
MDYAAAEVLKMRYLLVLSVLLLGVSWVAAQNYPSSGQTPSTRTSAGTEKTVEGCLSESGGKYTLTDSRGKSFELTGDTSKLAEHVGHEVKITGSEGSQAAGTSSQTTGNESERSIDVTSVKHISKTCKSSSGGMAH